MDYQGKSMRFKTSKIMLGIIASSLLPTHALAADQQIDSEEQIESIVITGSRIQRSSAATPTPTTVLDSKQIQQLGLNNAGDILNTLPAFSQSIGRANTDGNDANSGLELLNLRGLGTERTLVLVNGRRHVGSQAGNTSVDVSTIPTQMIERVEVITGAASAVYGADAVSGVVNFIMKQSFEGFQANIQSQQSSRHDGQEKIFSMLTGTTFANDQGNILFSLDYSDRKSVRAEDRDYASRGLAWYANENDTGPNDGIASQRMASNNSFLPLNAAGIASSTGFRGYYGPIGDLGVLTFDANGKPIPFVAGNCQGIRCENGMGFTTTEYAVLSVPTERTLTTLAANYALPDGHTVFLDAKYSHTVGENTAQPSFSDGVFGPIIQVGLDNPYLAESIRNEMIDKDIPVIYVNKANADLGKLPTENIFDVFQFVTGGNGELSESLSYDFYLQHGQSKSKNSKLDRLVDNFVQAQDAILNENGDIACRDTSNNCVPLNPFGPNAASAEAIDFIMRPTEVISKLKQTVLNFSLNGDLYELPAGPIQFAAGFEYRKESSESIPEDILLVGGLTNNTHDGPRQIVKGDYNVKEIFSEFRIPLISDITAIQDLSFETAVRYSDYSTVGAHTSYKLGLDWIINDSIRTRVSHGLAVRAPNVGELYQPEELTFEFIEDPCDFRNVNNGPAPDTRRANCATLGIPAEFESLAEGAAQKILVTGNPSLKAEESESTTIGIVYTPQWAQGLSIALDHWNITIDDAIAQPETDDIMANCVDFDMTDNPFCDLFSRNDAHQINNVRSSIINIAKLDASGYDLESNYHLDFEQSGSLLVNLVGSYYEKRNNLLNPEKPEDVIREVGIANTSKLKLNLNATYTITDWSAHLSLKYIGSSRISYTDTEGTDGEYPQNHIPSVVYANVRGGYQINDTMDLYVGVNNLTDKAPPVFPETAAGSSSYDGVGRAYYLGLNYQF